MYIIIYYHIRIFFIMKMNYTLIYQNNNIIIRK